VVFLKKLIVDSTSIERSRRKVLTQSLFIPNH